MNTPQALLVAVIHWFWTAKYLPLILLSPILYFVPPQALHLIVLWAIGACIYLWDVIVWLVYLRSTWIYLSIGMLVYFIHPETSPIEMVAYKSRDTSDTGKRKFRKYMEAQKAYQ